MKFPSFLQLLGQEVEDVEEETFLLFSQSLPSQDLGFVDSQATVLELTIAGRDLAIHQSPTILSSNRGGGTTGAVVWKITPLFASWMVSPTNPLFRHQILRPESAVLELGCGIAGVTGLVVAPLVRSYVLTDQSYVLKLLNQNLSENQQDTPPTKQRKGLAKPKKGAEVIIPAESSNIVARSLDWETDEIEASLTGSNSIHSFDAVIACDCIYNDALIEPLVQTCVDACKLRSLDGGDQPTVCVVAQQLRSDEVFQGWLKAFNRSFRTWRIPDEQLIDGLKTDSGFAIHVGILREV